MADVPTLEPADKAKADPKADAKNKAKADKVAEKAAAEKAKADKQAEKAKAKADKAKAKEAAGGGGGKTKLIILIAVGTLVLGGGGVGAWMFLGAKHGDDKTEQADAKSKAKAGKAGKAGKGKAEEEEKIDPKTPAIYVALDPPFVVNFEIEQNVRFLQVAAQVMTRDPETAELLKANDPMIRNDMLMLLGNQDVKTVSTREGKEALRAQALETVRKVVTSAGGKPKRVEAVFFTSFVMQ